MKAFVEMLQAFGRNFCFRQRGQSLPVKGLDDAGAAEAHLRDVPAAHLQKSDFEFLYGERAASALIPIGLEEIIARADSKHVRDFYEATDEDVLLDTRCATGG